MNKEMESNYKTDNMSNENQKKENVKMDNKKMKNKKDTPKKDEWMLAKFIIGLVISVCLGFVAGIVTTILKENVGEIDKQEIIRIMAMVVPIIFGIFDVVLIIVSMVVYFSNVKLAKSWDGEDEEVIERIEARQNIPMTLSSVLMIGGMFLFSLCAWLIDKQNMPLVIIKGGRLWIVLALEAVSIIGTIIIQSKVVGLEKKLNPEKKGNIFDPGFLKDWEKSSDEAEMLIQYKGGYKAFLAGNMVCMGLWLVSFMGMLMFDTGLMAVFCVCAIWLAMMMIYAYEVARL